MSSLEKINDIEFVLRGDLTFDTINNIYQENLDIFKRSQSSLSISLEGVVHVDSSGLALIVEWYRLMKKNNHQLNIIKMPQQMADLAKLSSVDELFSLDKD